MEKKTTMIIRPAEPRDLRKGFTDQPLLLPEYEVDPQPLAVKARKVLYNCKIKLI